MSDRPLDPHINFHSRLLERDPTAPADLAQAVLGVVLERLRRKYPNFVHDGDLDDSVADAILSYCERPEQFVPSKMSLLAYLTMSADGDFRNALARARRRSRRVLSLEVVEESPARRKTMHERAHSADDIVIERMESERLTERVRAAAHSPAEIRILQLMVDGERRTDHFASVLGVQRLSVNDQRRLVKQVKDRLKKRLVRFEGPEDE